MSSGLVLSNNGVNLPVATSNTTFSFGSVLNAGTAYSVAVQTQPTGLTCSVANGTGVTGSANVGNVVVTCSAQSYSLSGTVSGLTSAGLVLANGSTTVTVPANATSFTFDPNKVAFGSGYAVTVQTQPSAQNCAVTSGTGTMPAANVINVTVTCSAKPFSVGGTISGLGAATGLVLANNGTSTVNVAANATTFNFDPNKVAFGQPYSVSVQSQPVGRTCSVSGNGTGTMPAADITTIAVTCSTLSYTVSGTVTGATASGLTLQLNGANPQNVAANGTSFSFPAIASGTTYAVTASAQPTGKTCTVSNGSGTVLGANITNVAVTCATATYTLGGTISSLTSSGLVLANSSDTVAPAANATQFTFPTGVAYNATYAVTVQTQPTALSCSITGGGTGTMTANVTSVAVGCKPASAGTAWTWVGGSQNTNPNGVYGTLGTGSSSNMPGGRNNAATWKDPQGNFYMAQGYGSSEVSYGELADVWKYSPSGASAGQWTWIAGPKTADSFPSWGTKGTPSGTTTPGGRQDMQVWQDAAGNLWAFGGVTLGVAGPAPGAVAEAVICQDMWKFDITTKQWTWMHGPNTCTAGATGNDISAFNWETTTGNGPVWGTQGVAASTNIPGNRRAAATWTDAAGNFWMFGGLGYNETTGVAEFHNDLWKYNPSTNQWTWMGGTQSTTAGSVLGPNPGDASVNYYPGVRQRAVGWSDTNGNFWLFGGQANTGGYYADLWKYNVASGQWAWMKGLTVTGSTGSYGSAQVAAAGNTPPSRAGAATWVDAAGTLWLFGGNNGTGMFNDLWNYQPSTGLWTWWYGYNTQNGSGTYPAIGTSSPTSTPGARKNQMRWIDATNHLWVLGGDGLEGTGTEGNLNDLWKY